MRTWLSDYAAKLLASGLIKREKLMGGFTSPLNCQLVRYRFDAAKMGYNGRIKREKKSPALMYPLNGTEQDCIIKCLKISISWFIWVWFCRG